MPCLISCHCQFELTTVHNNHGKMQVFFKLLLLLVTISHSLQFRIESNSTSVETDRFVRTSVTNSSGSEIDTFADDSADDKSDDDSSQCDHCLDIHYFGHYFAQQCIPMKMDSDCREQFCPQHFDCPNTKTSEKFAEFPESCVVDGLPYSINSVIPSNDPCRQCLCKQTESGVFEMSCTVSECPTEVFEELKPNCFRKYSKDKCCPELVCSEEFAKIQCELDNREYRYGDNFSPLADPCTNCVCDEHWNATVTSMEKSCTKTQCKFESKPDCVPVYSPSACCPLYYHCPSETKSEDKEPRCRFGEDTYSIGEKIDTPQNREDSKTCLECTCMVPPQITCTQFEC